jgi:hypothetical protein
MAHPHRCTIRMVKRFRVRRTDRTRLHIRTILHHLTLGRRLGCHWKAICFGPSCQCHNQHQQQHNAHRYCETGSTKQSHGQEYRIVRIETMSLSALQKFMMQLTAWPFGHAGKASGLSAILFPRFRGPIHRPRTRAATMC